MSFNVPNTKYKDMFVPTQEQTVFTLGATPTVVHRFINGIESTEELSISGRMMTYIGTDFVLTPRDLITVYYE